MEILGYHGTDERSVNDIIRNGFNPSGQNNWLGSGVYFFGDSPGCNGCQEAESWAKHVRRFKHYGVFESRILSNNFIDIYKDINHRKIYDQILVELLNLHLSLGLAEKDFTENSIFIKLDEDYSPDVVIAEIEGAGPKKFIRRIVRRPQIQICVKKLSCITTRTLIKGA